MTAAVIVAQGRVKPQAVDDPAPAFGDGLPPAASPDAIACFPACTDRTIHLQPALAPA
ncbi:hypothetical protein ACFU3E_07855 [Streptomyces sp. NPDC057424]|uniref:hypothetical protein n=1 Tax=Streptomyces sp. NPDC057424 TaxID=3346127 RepID=UPI0036BCCDB4